MAPAQGWKGFGFFCWERHIAEVPELNRSLGSLNPVGKGRLGATNCYALSAVRGTEMFPPTLLLLLSRDFTAAKGALFSCCFMFHFWDPFLLFCAGALSILKKS